jgi:hypothetical protein
MRDVILGRRRHHRSSVLGGICEANNQHQNGTNRKRETMLFGTLHRMNIGCI